MMDQFLIGKKLFDKTMGVVQKTMDIRSARHQVISGNIANVETPDYVAKDLPFQKVFESSLGGPGLLALKRTHQQHLPVHEEESMDFSRDIEMASAPGVDVDQQMANLAENNLKFQAGVQALIKKFEALKVSVTEVR
jgi:flagellar basal-body rod protein FlgB